MDMQVGALAGSKGPGNHVAGCQVPGPMVGTDGAPAQLATMVGSIPGPMAWEAEAW